MQPFVVTLHVIYSWIVLFYFSHWWSCIKWVSCFVYCISTSAIRLHHIEICSMWWTGEIENTTILSGKILQLLPLLWIVWEVYLAYFCWGYVSFWMQKYVYLSQVIDPAFCFFALCRYQSFPFNAADGDFIKCLNVIEHFLFYEMILFFIVNVCEQMVRVKKLKSQKSHVSYLQHL